MGLATHARAGAARDALRLPPAPTTRDDETDDEISGHARPRVCAANEPAVAACSEQTMPCERLVGVLERAAAGERLTASTWWVSVMMGLLAVGWWWAGTRVEGGVVRG